MDSETQENHHDYIHFDVQDAARCVASVSRREHSLKLNRFHETALVCVAAHAMYCFLGQGAGLCLAKCLVFGRMLLTRKK